MLIVVVTYVFDRYHVFGLINESEKIEQKQRQYAGALKQTRDVIGAAAESIEESDPGSESVLAMKGIYAELIALENQTTARSEAMHRLANELVRKQRIRVQSHLHQRVTSVFDRNKLIEMRFPRRPAIIFKNILSVFKRLC